jgi:hypothetical protein
MVKTRAQISKGAIWLGGSIGYSTSKGNYQTVPDLKTNNLNINPAIGKVVKDNLVVGINFIYNRSNTENSGYTVENKGRNYGGGIFVRRYIPVASRLYLFGDASASFQTTNEKSVTNDYNSPAIIKTTTKGSISSLGVSPGVSFAINRKIHIESSLNNLFIISYNESNTTSDVIENAKKTSNTSAGLFADGKTQLNIGIRILLNNKGNG